MDEPALGPAMALGPRGGMSGQVGAGASEVPRGMNLFDGPPQGLEIHAGTGQHARMPFAILVLVLAAGWRIFTLHVPALSNFSPVMALAFCAGAYTRNQWMRLAPFAALVLSDLYIDHYYAAVYHYQWGAGGAASRIICFMAA